MIKDVGDVAAGSIKIKKGSDVTSLPFLFCLLLLDNLAGFSEVNKSVSFQSIYLCINT